MKLILIHGNFTDALAKKIDQIKKEFDPLSVTEISSSETGQNFLTESLFSAKRLVILENPDIKVIEKVILEKNPDLTLLIKFSKLLEESSPILKKVTENKGEIFIFNDNNQTLIFPMLDMLGTKNGNVFREFEKNYKEFGGQYILTMIAYFLRRLVVKSNSGSDYMRQKIENQKRNFSLEKITLLYKNLIETDFKIKQGLLEERLGVTILIQKILS